MIRFLASMFLALLLGIQLVACTTESDYGSMSLPQLKGKAASGDAEAQFSLGLNYHSEQNFREAADWWRKAAEQGHAPAQYNLALIYDKGQGVKQDFREALTWYRKAADQGNGSAQYNLGVLYYMGEGVVQDDQQAASWYRRAAEQGFATSQYALGLMHADGQGVQHDYVLAYALFSLAVTGGDRDAAKSRDLIVQKMTPEQIEEGKAILNQWQPGKHFPTASKTGKPQINPEQIGSGGDESGSD